jgi:hypothetical protein
MVNLAAARTGQIALEQRLEHQHQRVALHPPQLAAGDVGPDAVGLDQRNSQVRDSYLRARRAAR